ncbi:MAG TPA: ABC transporter ATP-binding protein [Mycobacteriales bacterium]|nr:ABC transporter ATP-binding protein [Mycobacteriales bacterium]
MKPYIRFENVGKRYVLNNSPLLISKLVPRRRQGLSEIWALKDISFAIDEGETVAIVGTNGAGKTTTLRLIAGVSAPTEGRLQVAGNVAPLIGIGVGFNPELSGRENIFVNGQLLGMTADEVRRNYDSIVAFSELEDYLESPVKYYSSGMFLRLGFSVAVHTQPQILVVDEILAVGDAAFQVKCNARIQELQQSGTTVVLVTHNLGLAVRMAKRAIVLNKGGLVFDGDASEAMGVYHTILSEIRDVSDTAKLDAGVDPDGLLGRADVDLDILDHTGAPNRHLQTGERFTVSVKAEFSHEVEDPCLGVGIVPTEGHDIVASAFTKPGEYRGVHGPGKPLVATVELDNHLATRSYRVHAEVFDSQRKWLLGASNRETFFVKSNSKYFGTVDLGGTVTVNGATMDNRAPQ